MESSLIEIAFWLLIAGAVLYIPAIAVTMIAYAIWEHRHPPRGFIGPTHVTCAECGCQVPLRFVHHHRQRHLESRRTAA